MVKLSRISRKELNAETVGLFRESSQVNAAKQTQLRAFSVKANFQSVFQAGEILDNKRSFRRNFLFYSPPAWKS